MPSDHKPTYIVDLDGVLIEHQTPPWDRPMKLIPGTFGSLRQWWDSGGQIIIMTARPECLRERTRQQLQARGIYYHQLIMGVTSGVRFLINDLKPYAPNDPTAIAQNVVRNKGL